MRMISPTEHKRACKQLRLTYIDYIIELRSESVVGPFPLQMVDRKRQIDVLV